ncbi:MAG: M23 family metallopeptidase [Anaerolineales bacterium]|nr:M23 family metallopeptidase [Anaerolineales bacterium]
MDHSENYPEYYDEDEYEQGWEPDYWTQEYAGYSFPYGAPRWSLVGLVLLVVFLMGFMFGRVSAPPVEAASSGAFVMTPAATPAEFSVSPPYKEYTLTQGPHGTSYGHYAIDIAAGKGSPILSPIDGRVKAVYVDQYGNTRLILDNERYEVTLLHGLYTVTPGTEVRQGQTVGSESNQGYTTDMQGRSCAGRDCGYHTHLNIYDKWLKANVNPLDLFPSAATE